MKERITVHATMTPPGNQMTAKDIDRRDRIHGLSRIGYHYVIERDGRVASGRPHYEASVHDNENEARSVLSVCLVGGVNEHNAPEFNFTEEQQQSLRDLIREIGEDKKITSVQSRTPAATDDRISQIIWRIED